VKSTHTQRMALAAVGGSPDFTALDDGKITRFQYKIMFISGMGFFTDAYDLFIIGVVVAILKPQWSLSTGQVSLLNSATLAASAVGAILFGRIADILGRKRIYGYEVLILALGAIASAFAPNFTFLLVSRVILGIGIGGDYPVSATIMSEYAGKRSRGKMVGLVFAMQGAGLVIGPLIAAILLATHVPTGIIWRVLLGLGAIPGLAVFYLRRQIHETPRFAQAGGDEEEALAAIAAATGASTLRGARPESTARHQQSVLEGFKTLASSRRMFLWLIGTAGAWAMLDFAYYGNTISSPSMPTARCSTTRSCSCSSSWCSPFPVTRSRSSCWTGRDERRFSVSDSRRWRLRSCSSGLCPEQRPWWRRSSSSSG